MVILVLELIVKLLGFIFMIIIIIVIIATHLVKNFVNHHASFNCGISLIVGG